MSSTHPLSIDTPRLHLRPATPADTMAVAALSNDPEIIRFLFHDASSEEKARAIAKRWCSNYGDNGPGSLVHDDGLGMFLLAPREGPEAGTVIGFCGLRFISGGVGPRDSELFYVLSRDWHGKGLASEAATALLDYNRGRPDFGPCFAFYWDLLNPMSERVLIKLGFVPAGRSLLVEYLGAGAEERIQGIVAFELWRLSRAAADQRARIAVEAATKIGQIAAEGVLSASVAKERLEPLVSGIDFALVEAALGAGMAAPGVAKMRLGTAALV